MDRLESDLTAAALADPTIGGLIGTRWYDGAAPARAVPPYVVWHGIGKDKWRSAEGPMATLDRRFEITAWATTESGSMAVAAAIEALLDGYTGTMGQTHIQDIVLENEEDEHEFAPEYAGKRMHGVRQFYKTTYDQP